MSENQNNREQPNAMSRRHFIRNAGLAVGGLAVGGALGAAFTNMGNKTEKKKKSKHEKTQPTNPNKALMYFNQEQFQIVETASERIFPKDENGPGAKDLHVAYFIDHQLAGAWGTGAKEYTSGPFYKGEPTQGYQGHLNRQQIFDIGLKGIQDYSVKTYGKKFPELTEAEQDAVLTDLSEDKIALKGVSSAYFFSILRAATIEGVYSDPLYGGNAEMGGWKMKNFPGHQTSYLEIIEKEEFVVIEPASLNSQHQH